MRMKTLALVLIVVGLLTASPAMAVKRGLYIGGSIGAASTETNQANANFDESDTAFKVFAGYHFLQFFAVEAAYRDLGSPSNATAKLAPTAFDVAGLVGMPVGPVYLFGKLGVARWDADANTANGNFSDDGTDYEAGIGISLDVIKIQLRGEVEYIDAADGVLMYTVGAAWRF
jgi:hypothetical protein